MSLQRTLDDLPVKEKDAERFAYNIIRSELGNIPYLGTPELIDNEWIIPIIVRYPRIIFDDKGKPKKTRFMQFEIDETIKINALNGELVERPRYYDMARDIELNLKKIRNTVEKALVKVGADRFSKLPFPAHMHTPITDILSWLLVNDTLNLETDLSLIGDEREKYMQNIEVLGEIGLVRRSDSLILPGSYLVEIETREVKSTPEKLSDALTFFFEKGYYKLESVHQVLGPHLTLSAYCYEKSLEYSELVPISYSMFDGAVQDLYREEVKRIKLPRYLLQLEGVGLITEKTIHGSKVWYGKEDIFSKIMGETEILEPVKNIIFHV